MQTKIDKFDFGSEYQKASSICKRLAQTIDEIELIRKDPSYYISECMYKLKNECDLKREELKLKIDNETDVIINELVTYGLECKENTRDEKFLAKVDEMGQQSREKKEELNEWLSDLRVLESEKWKKVNEQGDTVIADLEKNLVQLKNNSMLDVNIEFQIPKTNEFIGILKNPTNG
jgi:hypothetical protein